MTNVQKQVWDALVSLDGEAVLRALTDYHGTQLLDEGFAEFLVDEGLLDPEVTGQDDDYDDEDNDDDDEEE
jgi:hypothetical protein